MKLRIAALIALAALQGCFFHESGTWDDDPENWERVFGTPKPEGVDLVHSRHWRSAHWTYEAINYMQIKAGPGFKEKLFSQIQVTKQAGGLSRRKYFDNLEVPPWYLPKDMKNYEAYVSGDTAAIVQVFVDKSDGTLFLFSSQL